MSPRPFPSGPVAAGLLLSLAATAIWSGNFIVSRTLGHTVDPVLLAFMRWFTATVCLLPFAARALVRERAAIRRNLPYLALTAFLGVTVFNTLIYVAGATTSVLNMALITTSMPAFTILFARVFLGEAITGRMLAGLCAAVVGVVLIVVHGDFAMLLGLEFVAGDLWVLFASSLFAIYSILVRRKPADLGPTAFLAACFGIGLVMLAPVAGWRLAVSGPAPMTPVVVGCVLYIGVFASLVAYWCWNGAVSRIGPAMAGMVYYSLPLFSGVEALAFLGEPVGWQHMVGGALIIGGIALANRAPRARGAKAA